MMNDPANRSSAALRIALLQIVVVLVLGGFSLRLWRLQVVAGQEYRELAQRNRTRLIRTDAERGVIYARDNTLLVHNVPRFNILLIPAYLPEGEEAKEAVLQRLHELLDLPLESSYAPPHFPPYWSSAELGLRDLVWQGERYAPYQPIILKRDASTEVAFAIEQEHLDLPGVLVELDPYRTYPTGDLTAHLLGYMGPIPAWAEEDYGEEQGYEPDDAIGLTGLEAYYEDALRGSKGIKTIEVDVAGREVRTLGDEISPHAGDNLVLTLDLDLQRHVEKVLRQGMEGADSEIAVAIVMEVNTGQVLSLVSLPTYDNNLFARGISRKEFVRLNADLTRPLFNYGIAGHYPSGSTFKLVPAAAGLQEGIVTGRTRLTCPGDSGILWLPNKYYPDDMSLAQPFYCWSSSMGWGHGRIDFVSAIANSCDVYFYQLAGGYMDEFEGLGLERLGEYARAFGYGTQTGIDLPAEAPGLVPDEKWKRLNYSERWTTGDTYNMAIGQGYEEATPLQVVNATAAVANGGTLYQPQLVYQIRDAEGNVVRDFTPQVIRELPVSDENLALVRQGMRAAVLRGTAVGMPVREGLHVAAKTGTAEFCAKYPDCMDEHGRIITTHAWFTAFAPYEDPEIAVLVFVYGGGEGAITSMPIAASILNYYFANY